MVETITEDVTKTDLKGVVSKLLPDATAKDIEKASQGIYPLHDVYIRKVSILYSSVTASTRASVIWFVHQDH